MKNNRNKIERFLAMFPTDEVCWSQATDEIRDMSCTSREYLEEFDNITVEPVEFRSIRTPAEWNSKGRESILRNYDMMTPRTQERFFKRFVDWFNTMEVNVGDKIRIGHLTGEDSNYDGREGVVEYIDSIGQLHGSWGGLAIIPETDDFVLLEKASDRS